MSVKQTKVSSKKASSKNAKKGNRSNELSNADLAKASGGMLDPRYKQAGTHVTAAGYGADASVADFLDDGALLAL
jgi:hypothetical protein